MRYVFPALVFFSSPFCIAASENLARDAEDVFVSATLSEQALNTVLGSAIVIDQREIVIKQPASLPQLLQAQAGVEVVRSGGRASQTSVFTRGTNSDHTLVLIDGIRFDSATSGQTQLQFLDPEQIERVEFIKGSRSALYGSDAIGGVINIITANTPQTRRAHLTAQAGSHDLQGLSGGISDTIDQFYYSAALSHERSEGIDNTLDRTGFSRDRDPYSLYSANVGLGYAISDQLDVSIKHFETQSEADYDSSVFSAATDQPYSRERQYATRVSLAAKANAVYSTQLSLGRSADNSNNADRQNPANKSHFFSERDTFFWLNKFSLNDQLQWDFGLDFNRESVASSTVYQDSNGTPVDDRDNRAVFGQAQWNDGRYSLILGLREDDNSAYGDHSSANAALGYRVNEALNVYASWGEGFKAPTFNDLFWPTFGNPDLLPEASESYEVGLNGSADNWNYGLSVFKLDVDNLIEWAPDASGDWRPQNVSAAEIKGSELSLSQQWDAFAFAATLSYTDARDSDSNKPLLSRAKTKFTLDFNREFRQNTVGILFSALGEREQTGSEPLPAYSVTNLYWLAELTTKVSLRVRANNIFDEDYQVNPLYNEDGANFSAKLTYRL